MVGGVVRVTGGQLCVVGRGLVVASLVVLCRTPVMVRCLLVVLRCAPMMVHCLL